VITAQDIVTSFLDAALSSSEEEIFGAFLEELAIFVGQRTLNAQKSCSPGLDLEFTKDDTRYLVTIKSGLNWGNSSQWSRLDQDFQNAVKVLKQSRQVKHIECILGVSYGSAKTTVRKGLITQVCGQSFWYLISGVESFYKEIIEPIGYKAKEHNEFFNEKKAEVINRFTKEFIAEFCDNKGKINWEKLIEFNSGNLTPEDKAHFK
jgi:hypothetical protein